jgi:hypothetical protein
MSPPAGSLCTTNLGIVVTTETSIGARCPCPACVQRKPLASPFTGAVEIPGPGEEVAWSGHLRADLPEYVVDQLRDVAHRQRRTLVSLLLQLMAPCRDADGRNVFQIRPEDLVADRRKATRVAESDRRK